MIVDFSGHTLTFTVALKVGLLFLPFSHLDTKKNVSRYLTLLSTTPNTALILTDSNQWHFGLHLLLMPRGPQKLRSSKLTHV